ncbi:MAG TPA: pilus assembly protein PilM [Myxococcota bacterium]|nr:pilus assembly protein PilM [Myxococcota bacterium]
MFERTVIGLDIGSWSLKLAEVSAGFRGAEFKSFAELPLPEGAPSEEIEATIQLWLQNRGTAPEVLVTALSTERLTQRHLRFPFAGVKRVAAAIGYEIDEELPVPLSSVVVGHEQVLTRPDQTDVLVALAARTDVEQHLAACRRMELEPRIVESEGASLANLTGFLGLSDVSRLVLDVGHAKTNLCLLVDGRPIALRRIPVAGAHFTAALALDLGLGPEAAREHKHAHGIFERGSTKPVSNGIRDLLEHLAREVQRSVQAIVGDPLDPVSPTEILLVGGSAQLPALARFFEERTGLPTRVLEVARTGEGAEEFAAAGPATFAQAAALALRGTSTERVTQTDFRQGELGYAPDLTGLRPQLRLTVGLFALFLVMWIASAAARAVFANHRATQLRGEVASILKQTFPDAEPGPDPLKTFETKAAETRALAAHLGVTGKGLSVLEILRQISALTPESLDVSLDELSIERQSVSARGHTSDFVSADQLKAELSKFEGFQRVLVTDVKTDARRGGKTFTVSIRLGDEEAQ